jgi:hypothetical protein
MDAPPVAVSDLNELHRPIRAPLKPMTEGWRRYALLGSIAIAVIGVLAALGAVYLLAWWITTAR